MRLAGAMFVVLAVSGLARGELPPPAPDHASGGSSSGKVDCGACHVESGWSEVRFNHSRTGFPLHGAHSLVACRACHRQNFDVPIPDTCAGCHRDRHASEFGAHCEGCHTDVDWRAALFASNGHRGTGFPLLGRHATIPCQECHGNLRDRAFDRAPLPCVGCHRADFNAAKLKSIDHQAAQFGTDCQACHNTLTFFPARFSAHDLCFELSASPHRPFRCQQCHTSVAGLMLTGTCNTQTTTCTSCHSHDCARSDRQHTNVMGYACVNAKCYQCHQRAGK